VPPLQLSPSPLRGPTAMAGAVAGQLRSGSTAVSYLSGVTHNENCPLDTAVSWQTTSTASSSLSMSASVPGASDNEQKALDIFWQYMSGKRLDVDGKLHEGIIRTQGPPAEHTVPSLPVAVEPLRAPPPRGDDGPAAAAGVVPLLPRTPTASPPCRPSGWAIPVLVETLSRRAGSTELPEASVGLPDHVVAVAACTAAVHAEDDGAHVSQPPPLIATDTMGMLSGGDGGGPPSGGLLDAVAASSEAVAKLRQMSGLDTPSTTTASSSTHYRLSVGGSEALAVADTNPLCFGLGSLGMSSGNTAGIGGSAGVGIAEGSGGGGQPPTRIFRRDLYSSEVATVSTLLDGPGRKGLKEQAAKEFDWALSVSGHVPGRPGRVDYAAALTALRQLAYLNGLPSLDSSAARWFFNANVARERSPMDVDDIVSEEFQAAVEHLLQYALAGSQL